MRMNGVRTGSSRDRLGVIAVHTGGGFYSKSLVEKIKPFCREACNTGLGQLLQGSSAVDAVTEAVAVLENCPYLNAGMGSNLNRAGIPELDASIVDGNDTSFGSVSCSSTLLNPIRAARLLLDNCKKGIDTSGLILPFMLSGPGVSHFGKERGLVTCTPEDLITQDSFKAYSEEMSAGIPGMQDVDSRTRNNSNLADTVGAVCIDSSLATASGCSSGGLLLKYPGRVGPAAVIGSGCYARSARGSHPSVACCTSGTGEILLRTQLARNYCEAVSSSLDPEPFTPLKTIFLRDIINNTSFNCYPERFTAVLGLCATKGDVEVIWGHNTPHFVIAYQSVCMKNPKFLVSKRSSDAPEAYSISSALLKLP